jgi:septal ring-binding cell division protein DamX
VKNEKSRWFQALQGSILLTNRHLGWLVAAVIMVNSCSFIVGYFWGKKAAAETACYAINRESFADKIYSAVSLRQGELSEEQGDDEKDDEGEGDSQDSAAAVVAQQDDSTAVTDNEKVPQEVEESPLRYYAQLAGFHSSAQAEQFFEKLRKKAIPVILKERISKTAKGRNITWYQVVAGPYDSREKITAAVAQLKKDEKIRDVRIVQS